MPKAGQKSITVKDSVYEIAGKLAELDDRSISNITERAIVAYANKQKRAKL